jgi:diguanylate cyclase (GGDEF)-like protein
MRGFDDREIHIDIVFKRPNKIIIFLVSLALTAVLGVTDFITGYEVSFSFFYLIPITVAVFFADFTTALMISVLSAASWFVADVYSGHTYPQALIPVWNVTMRFLYFILHSFLLSRFIKLYEVCRLKSVTDALTHAVNAEFFYELTVRESEKSKRSRKPITLAYLDLDNFKSMNDTLGHHAGDVLLQALARLITENIRPSDVFGRLGGDEFALLLPETDRPAAETVLERLRDKVNREMETKDWRVTLSIGAITFWKTGLSVDEMVKRADDIMYLAKKSGKNRIEYGVYE